MHWSCWLSANLLSSSQPIPNRLVIVGVNSWSSGASASTPNLSSSRSQIIWSLAQPSGTKQRLWKKPVFCLDIRWPQSSFPGLQEWCESPIAMGRFWLELDFTRKHCKTGNKLSIQFSPKWWDQFLAPRSCYRIPYGDQDVCQLAAEHLFLIMFFPATFCFEAL